MTCQPPGEWSAGVNALATARWQEVLHLKDALCPLSNCMPGSPCGRAGQHLSEIDKKAVPSHEAGPGGGDGSDAAL